MWDEKDAIGKAEEYFREDEKAQFVYVLPWFYAFSKGIVLLIAFYLALCFATWYCLSPIPALAVLLMLALGVALMWYIGSRSLYHNSIVITQYAVYHYIRKTNETVGEIKWQDVASVSFEPWLFSKKYATVILECKKSYIRQMPAIKRKQDLKHAQERPTQVDFRDLCLEKPIHLHLVVKKYSVLYRVLEDIRAIGEYDYILIGKRKT